MESFTPPNAPDAEQSVLGSIMIDNSCFEDIITILSPESFYAPKNEKIFTAMQSVYKKGEPIDLVTVTEELRTTSKLESVGNVPYIIGLTSDVPTAAYADKYAGIVKEKHQLRLIIKSASQLIQMAADEQNSEDILSHAAKNLIDLSKSKSSDFIHISETLPEVVDNISNGMSDVLSISNPSTGFKSLDRQISDNGFGNGTFNVLAARPAMGKSALANDIGAAYGLRGDGVAIFNHEMSGFSIVKRMLGSQSRVDMKRLQSGDLTDKDFQRITDKAGLLAESNIFIDDTVNMTIEQMKSKARNLFIKEDIKLIIVDYLQLITGGESGSNSGNRQQEISHISRQLKALARELDIPVLALSQLSRAVEQRPNKRPMLSDLRESGAIEQDADMVMFIYRDEYYDPHSEDQGIAEVIIGKQRSGPVGTVKLQFHDTHVRFNDLAAV